jgi:hypothetical protein
LRRQQEFDKAEEERKGAEMRDWAQQRREAKRFNNLIVLPARWGVGIRDVLSGLAEGSWGDGRNGATVDHMLLFAPLAVGRLKRREGDLLCASNARLNGKNWSGRRTRLFGPGEEVT